MLGFHDSISQNQIHQSYLERFNEKMERIKNIQKFFELFYNRDKAYAIN